MNRESGEFTPEEAETPQVDEGPRRPMWAIVRDVENTWGFSFDEPRPDQHGTSDTYERLPVSPGLRSDWLGRAEHIMTITYNLEAGTVVYTRSGDKEFPDGSEPPTQDDSMSPYKE